MRISIVRLFLLLLIQVASTNSFAVSDSIVDLASLNKKAELLLQSSPDEGIELLKEVFDRIEEPKDLSLKAEALKLMGVAHYYKQNNRQSLEYYEQGLAIYRSLEDKAGMASILNNTGLLFDRQGDYSEALKRYNHASLLFTEAGNELKLTASLSNIGNVYFTLGRYDLALDYLTQALKIAQKLSDNGKIASAYNNIGNIYLSLKDYKRATKFFHDAEKLDEASNNRQMLTIVYNNLGIAYLELNKIPEALKYNQLSMEIAHKINDTEGVISNLINIGDIYCKLKDYDEANINYKEALRISTAKQDQLTHASILISIGKLRLIQKMNDEAIQYLKEALPTVEKTGSYPLLNDIYKGLSQAYAARGNYESALQYLQKHEFIADSIYDSENMNRLNMIRVSFELEQTERDNQLLRQQYIYSQLALKRQQTIRNLLIMISAIVIVFSFFLFLLYYSKKKKNVLLALRNNQVSAQKTELDKLYLEQFKLNDIKNKFFSIVAHDLKSPFQSLLGFSELLSEEYDHFTDKQRREAINNIYKVTTDTYRLIENLLEWGRIQTGSATASMKIINLRDLVTSVIPIFESTLNDKKLSLENDLPPLLLASADPNMISAVLRNVISNAIKFSNQGGTIKIIGSSKDNMTEISITDNGIGMAKDVLNKLFTFDPKVRRVGTRGETGTGMGLGLCLEFMQLNNGVIKVKSEPGNGSTFNLLLQPAGKSHMLAEIESLETSIR